MSERKAFADGRLEPAEFERFEENLRILLKAFPARKLAKWMGKDRGNLSKKINGIEPITSKFLGDFYGRLHEAIRLLKRGMPPHEVENIMDGQPEEEPGTFVQLQLAFRDAELKITVIQREVVEIKEELTEDRQEMEDVQIVLREHEAAIKALQARVFGRG